jgi:hypothetical protein
VEYVHATGKYIDEKGRIQFSSIDFL